MDMLDFQVLAIFIIMDLVSLLAACILHFYLPVIRETRDRARIYSWKFFQECLVTDSPKGHFLWILAEQGTAVRPLGGHQN